MTLTSIAEEINRRAEVRPIGRLQGIRQEIKGLRQLPYHQIFHPKKTVFEDGDGGYAFHYGGRTELQFNIGSEPGKRLRHGVAFSFEPSRTLTEPEMLVPSVRRFNEFLRVNADKYSNMLMWYWDEKGHRSVDYAPSPIQPGLIRRGVFICMGRMQPFNAIDFDLVLDDLDRLLPLYRFVEGNAAFPEIVEPAKRGFLFKPGCSIKPSSTSASVTERELNINLRHNELQAALHAKLVSLYGKDNVGTEQSSAGGQVDVVVRQQEKFWFYEIKTAMSARGCIREALAQLLEYSFWPGAQEAERLIIVGEPALDEEAARYLTVLANKFSLPVEYQQFELTSTQE